MANLNAELRRGTYIHVAKLLTPEREKQYNKKRLM